MDQNALIMTIVFAVVFAVLYIADVFKFYSLRATLQPILDVAFPTADRWLAEFGDELAPVHEVMSAAKTLIDQDTDTLVKTLPPEAIAQLRLLLDTAITLTDGEVSGAGAGDAA
jgi:hypothetical protein